MHEPKIKPKLSIFCPRCWRESFNAHDIENGYCGGCHEFTAPPKLFGPVYPNAFAIAFCTGFWEFCSPTGIEGLMKWHDGRLDLLAVIASKPRTGQFREFIKQAKLISKTITVMIDDNPIVGPICARYGFRPVMETFPIINGTETANGWRWDAL